MKPFQRGRTMTKPENREEAEESTSEMEVSFNRIAVRGGHVPQAGCV